MLLWMLPVMVARSKVYDAECTVGIVFGYHAALLELCHYLTKLVGSCRYYL